MGISIDPQFGVNRNTTLEIIVMKVYVLVNPTYRVDRNFEGVLKKNKNIAVIIYATYTVKWGHSYLPAGAGTRRVNGNKTQKTLNFSKLINPFNYFVFEGDRACQCQEGAGDTYAD